MKKSFKFYARKNKYFLIMLFDQQNTCHFCYKNWKYVENLFF